ncbi:MAG: hypothetical protein H6Q26_1410 [Bacteroidetes bacterium]|nr:hypothetical protein [Bacteroidota bacterium]
MNPKSKFLLKKVDGNTPPSLHSKKGDGYSTLSALKDSRWQYSPSLQSEIVDDNTSPLFNSPKVKDQVSVIIPGFHISTIPYEKFTALKNITLRATFF